MLPKGVWCRFSLNAGSRLIALSDEESVALIPAETFNYRMKKAMEYTFRTSEAE